MFEASFSEPLSQRQPPGEKPIASLFRETGPETSGTIESESERFRRAKKAVDLIAISKFISNEPLG